MNSVIFSYIHQALLKFTRLGGVFLALSLMACGQHEANNQAQTQVIRPVVTFRVGEQTDDNNIRFSGVVQSRFQTNLAFQVSGKLLARLVNVGDKVHKGQLLAKLETNDYQLALQGFKSQLNAARLELDFSKENIARLAELFQQKLISPAELQRHQTNYESAKEKFTALKTQYEHAANQLAYTQLIADKDGVVTQIQMEVGQVIQQGQPVIQLAQDNQPEIMITLPEQLINQITIDQAIHYLLWVHGDQQFSGSIREISKEADPASRTYPVKVTINTKPDDLRLGMTATVILPLQKQAQIAIPLSSVFSSGDNQYQVWIVDEKNLTVHAMPIQLGASLADEKVAVSGLTAGQLIVRAGTHHLQQGQAIRLLNSGLKFEKS